MRSLWVASLLLLISSRQLPARTYHEVTELDAVFDRYGCTGTFVLFDPARDRMEVSNKLRAQQRVAGAPIFALANLDGRHEISAMEETEFLARLLVPKGPIKEEPVGAMRKTTLIERTNRYELHGKASLLSNSKHQIGWWVGWIEREGRFYSFALNFDISDDAEAAKRIPIGRECLKALGKL